MYLPVPQPFRLECGWLNAQAFRWREKEGWFYGIVGGHLIRVRNAGDGIECEGDAPDSAVRHYFRLDQDIGKVHKALCEADRVHMPKLIEEYGHIRVLRQDPWECLVAYICSPISSVDSIRGKLNRLADRYGDVLTLDGVSLNRLPPPERLADVDADELRSLSLGLPSITDAIHAVALDIAAGRLDLDVLSRGSHAEARERLKEYANIGDKIAGCVCLFSLGKDDAFPVDAHIGKALKEYYGKKYTPGAKNVRLMKWVGETFGTNAGYAGQLLFLDQWS